MVESVIKQWIHSVMAKQRIHGNRLWFREKVSEFMITSWKTKWIHSFFARQIVNSRKREWIQSEKYAKFIIYSRKIVKPKYICEIDNGIKVFSRKDSEITKQIVYL